MGAPDDFREPIELDAESFIAVKSVKAKGKRVTTFKVAAVEELEPTRKPQEPEPSSVLEPVDVASSDDDESQEDVRDELNGQMHLFD